MNNEKIAEAEAGKAADGRITGADKRGILEKYCGLDTMGMVEILRVLREMADK